MIGAILLWAALSAYAQRNGMEFPGILYSSCHCMNNVYEQQEGGDCDENKDQQQQQDEVPCDIIVNELSLEESQSTLSTPSTSMDSTDFS